MIKAAVSILNLQRESEITTDSFEPPQHDQHQPLHGMVNRRHDSLALPNPQWLTASSANNAGEPSNFTSAVPNRTRLYGARKERLLGFLGVREATRAPPMR